MGFIPVLLHLRTILRNMRQCQEDIVAWQPDVVILVDYPGFNLKIAEYIKKNTQIPVYYYISPKIWAWKEYRIKNIKRDVDELFSILPFEIDFFAGYRYPIHYVGNPCVDAVDEYCKGNVETFGAFAAENGLNDKPVIALLAGSRKQEIRDNLPVMLRVAARFPEYQPVIAGAPGIDPEYYRQYTDPSVQILFQQTYPLLQHSDVALVTSGTATLETALFRVPQVVCYYVPAGRLATFIFKHFFHTPYISLVNLIAGKEVVQELFGERFSEKNITTELGRIVHNKTYREKMLQHYDEMIRILGKPGASRRAAELIVGRLSH